MGATAKGCFLEDAFTTTPDSCIWDFSPMRLGAAKTQGNRINRRMIKRVVICALRTSDREGRAYAILPLGGSQLMILREQPEAMAA